LLIKAMVPFTTLYPDFEEYFEEVRLLAGESEDGVPGRRLPKFEKWWRRDFDKGHVLRIEMWKRENEESRRKLGLKGKKKKENGEKIVVEGVNGDD